MSKATELGRITQRITQLEYAVADLAQEHRTSAGCLDAGDQELLLRIVTRTLEAHKRRRDELSRGLHV